MGVACWFAERYTRFTIHSSGLVQLVVFLAVLSGATGLYLAAGWLFRCREIEEIYGIATRRNRAGEGYVEA